MGMGGLRAVGPGGDEQELSAAGVVDEAASRCGHIAHSFGLETDGAVACVEGGIEQGFLGCAHGGCDDDSAFPFTAGKCFLCLGLEGAGRCAA